MSTTLERMRYEAKHHASELTSAVSILAATVVIIHYKHKYGGDVLFTVSPEVMSILHNEGTAILQELPHGRYTLSAIPKF